MQASGGRNPAPYFAFLILPLIAAHLGCRASEVWITDQGVGAYELGVPNFDLQVTVSAIEGAFGADVRVAVTPSSLRSVPPASGRRRGFDVLVRVFDRSERLLSESAFSDTLRLSHAQAPDADAPIFWIQRLDTGSGTRLVQVILIDHESSGQSSRVVRLEVPDGSEPYLGEPILEGNGQNGATVPFLGSLVPASSDSLLATIQYASASATPADVRFTLLRVERDSEVATPPYWVSPGYGSLQFRGIAPLEADTVQAITRRIPGSAGATSVAFHIPRLDEGVYRLEFEAHTPGARPLSRTRFITITPPGFPHLLSIDQMVESLRYIAFEGEIRRIREGGNAQAMRARFDAFWGSLLPRRQAAAHLLESYYSRIEEANLRFSSFKEGWKTDRGMIFVLLGAPLEVFAREDVEVWRYAIADDATQTFTFDRVPVPDAGRRYDNYVLRRRPYYEQVWAQAMDRWRHGIKL